LALSHIHSFHLLVVDSPLGAELQIELLEAFMDQNPKAEVILTAAEFATPGNRGPKIHVLAQPVNPLELLSLVRECRERVMSPDAPSQTLDEEENHFVVVLNRHTPIEVIQFKCLAGATTALDFIRRSGPGGRIWFERGEICHAETGNLTGEDALVEMIGWPGGSIVEVVAPPPLQKTIDLPWQSLLMQAAHLADERRAQMPPKPEPKMPSKPEPKRPASPPPPASPAPSENTIQFADTVQPVEEEVHPADTITII
jgi:hypothetical protein